MRYYGGKYRTGKDISTILKYIAHAFKIKGYIEPFCGALGVMRHMEYNKYKCYALDGCEDIILLWNDIKNNKFKKPKNINQELWNNLKYNKPSSLRAYIGFGYSYGGQWFNSFIKNYDTCVNDDNIYNNIIKMKSILKKIDLYHRDYKNHLKIIEKGGYLIYCDPPYVNSTHKHKGSKYDFNKNEFWKIVRKWRNWGNIIVVSERNAPKDFTLIWNKKLNNAVSNIISSYDDKLFISFEKNKIIKS